MVEPAEPSAGRDDQTGVQPWSLDPPRAAAVTWVGKLVMWGLVVCGPLSLAAALGSSSGDRVAAMPVPSARVGTGPAGFAQLYVAAYLRSGSSDDALRAYFPDAPPVPGQPGSRWATGTVVTGIREMRPGYWSVVVAAEVQSAAKNGAATGITGLHLFAVPILATGDREAGGPGPEGSAVGYVATALPAEVAAPPVGAPAQLGYDPGQGVPDGPLSDAVTQFLAAYLTGRGELDRYLSPGRGLRPITPAPYRQVSIDTITGTGELPGGGITVPADGAQLHVLASVEVTDAVGQRWPLTYALTLSSRAGRWEIAALDPGPVLKPTTTSAPTP